MIQQGHFVLPRYGNSPLRFYGTKLASECGDDAELRWYTIDVYQTQGGKYVVHVVFHTNWRGESDHDWVAVVDDAHGVAEALRKYDVLPPGRGYPPGYEEKQQHLRAILQRDFDDLATDLLESQGVFAEEIE